MIHGKSMFYFIGGGAAGAAEALTSSTTIQTFTIPEKCKPIRAGVTITTSNGSKYVDVKFTGAGGTTGNCGIVRIPSDAVAGECYYENTDYVDDGTGAWLGSLDEGEQVIVTTVVEGASPTAYGIPWLKVELSPEMPANNSSMVEAGQN
jgi:hypothetical protein